ncbi:MCE family protein [Mycobacterium branderi]|uniref:Mammalian cell entry protein n=1 Tax=Mycobacterium branderi TaxID=43348 RepID=A0A7I7W5I1_9MYCO|nr:MCE family protein [Mycobacterium branderi]MCV7230905.1 MCE family protein [Mycobacterium branderi]ORA38856.1 mammalian cell entry protein [Mycobacterium branderi]BBZ12197.1 mammalian cell entry protein [Mycobacterium branderi]
MIPRNRLAAGLAIALAALIVIGAGLVVRHTFFRPKTITAFFTTATAIYPGDEVRVSGVKVGNIASIQPVGTQAKMTLHVDRDVPIPADAKAVIVAQNLVAARYVELAPAYRTNGPTMPDGAVIPADRTAVPVEWDEVKTQLTRLATDLGPNSKVSTPSVARFIDSAANSLEGNGDKLRQTLAQLSGVGRILANGSGNIVDIIKNLQTFVTALRDSNTQIVQFQDRFATLTSVLNESRSDLDAALKDLSVAVGEVQRFVAGTRDKTSEQIARLVDVTQNLVEHRTDVENILHVAPNAFANFYNIYSPATGLNYGVFVVNQFSNTTFSICTSLEAIENITASESGKLCAQYLGPGLRLLNFINYLPIPTNPWIAKAADPEDVIYTDPALIPCHPHMEACEGGLNGTTPTPPEIPPTGSAYTGLPGDNIPNWGPGAFWAPPPPSPPRAVSLPPEPPAGGPAPVVGGPASAAAPAAQPVAPGPPPPAAAPPTVPDMLLPAERPGS